MLYFKPSDRISSIKERFCRLIKFKDIKQFKCIYKGDRLEDNKKIEDYNILNNDTIAIVLSLRG